MAAGLGARSTPNAARSVGAARRVAPPRAQLDAHGAPVEADAAGGLVQIAAAANEPEPTVALQLLRVALDARMLIESDNRWKLRALTRHGV